jgi:hypothetical protein
LIGRVVIDDPVMIRLPRSAIWYLKAGDTIEATFEEAKDGKYLVMQMFMFVVFLLDMNLKEELMVYLYSGLDSGTEKLYKNRLHWTKRGGAEEIFDKLGLDNSDDEVNKMRSGADYQKRREEMLKTPPPEDRSFPEEIFTEEWFNSREMDIGSDDEIGTLWDETEEEGEEEEED